MKPIKYFHDQDNDLLSKKQIQIKKKYFDIMDRAMSARTVADIKKLIEECNAFEASLDGESINITFIIETLVSKENTIARAEQDGKRCMLTIEASEQHSMDAAHNEFWSDDFQKEFDRRYKIVENYISSVNDVSNAIDSMESSYDKKTGKYQKEQEDEYFKHAAKLLEQNVDIEKEQNYQHHYRNQLTELAVQIEKDRQRQEQLKKEMELIKTQEENEQKQKAQKVVSNRMRNTKVEITPLSKKYKEKSTQHDFIKRNIEHKEKLLEHHVNQYNQKENQLYRIKKSVIACWNKIKSINKNALSSEERKIKHNQIEVQIKANYSKASRINLNSNTKNNTLTERNKLNFKELKNSAREKVQNSSSTDVQSQVEHLKEEPKIEDVSQEAETQKKRGIKEIIKNTATKIKDVAIAVKTKIFGEKKENWFDVPNCQTPEQKKLVKDMESGKISSDKFNAEMKSQGAQPGTKEYEEFMKEYKASTKPGTAYQQEQKAIETRRKEQELQEQIKRRRDHPEPRVVDPHPLRAQGKLQAMQRLENNKISKLMTLESHSKQITIDPPTPTPSAKATSAIRAK